MKSSSAAWIKAGLVLIVPLFASGLGLYMASLCDECAREEDARSKGVIADLVERLGRSMQLEGLEHVGDLCSYEEKARISKKLEEELPKMPEWSRGGFLDSTPFLERKDLDIMMHRLECEEDTYGADLLFRSFDHDNDGLVSKEAVRGILEALLEQQSMRHHHATSKEVALRGEMILPITKRHLCASDATVIRDAFETLTGLHIERTSLGTT